MKPIYKILMLLIAIFSFIAMTIITGGPETGFEYYMYMSVVASIFLLWAFIYVNKEAYILKRVKNRVLLLSCLAAAHGLSAVVFDYWVSFKYMWIILAVLCYCFFYAPLELKLKVRKWSKYSKNTVELIGLSSLDFIGFNLLLIGSLNLLLGWPGQEVLITTGIIVLGVGTVFWNRKFKSEVILRKTSEDKIKHQYEIIKAEKQKSDTLLLNILPAEIAEELKEKGEAKARDFEMVSILFTDFKGFTEASEKLNAHDLVSEINTCFEAFDGIMTNYSIEKIKTIGDAYMAAGGLPVPSDDSIKNTILAALEMQDFIGKRKATMDAQNKPAFEMRVGIHTGPVVAGIVGVKKFQYDIWGDTVNTASRIESNGEIGKVNISYATFELLKEDPDFEFDGRGKIEAKGKGMIDMYFVSLNKERK